MIASLRAAAAITLVFAFCFALSAPRAEARDETPPLATPPVQRAPELQLSEGRLAYERGDYAVAVTTIVPLLYPSILLSTEEAVIEAHRLLALSYLLQRKQNEAEEEAASILALRPSFQLDPIVDPPMAVAFFETVRKRQDNRLRELRDREQKEAERQAKEAERRRLAEAERVNIEPRIERRSRLVATIPFGVGQWQNGQNKKAALFLASELVFGAISLGGYVALEQKYPVDPHTSKRFYPAAEKSTAQALIGLQLGAGVAFWATLVWGIIDAHVLFKKDAPKKQTGTLKSLMLAPTIAPGQVSLGVQGAF